MRGFKVYAVGVLVLAVLVSPAARAATKQQQLDQLFTKYHQVGQFNGTVLVAGEKGVIHKKGYGFANFEWRVPHTTDTKFRLASITKQFTATVILQLVAEGKLGLDDTVTKLLPDYRKDTGDRVTLTHLLNHTSGIPSYTHRAFFQEHSRDPYSVTDFVKKFCSGDLEFEPGTKYVYNNSAYFLLGAIIEKVTGKTYAQALQERIFTPLGMKDSGYDVSATVLSKRASGYEPTATGYVNAPYLDMSLPYAAGSLYSTVEDLHRWDRALYTDTLLPAALKQRMFTPGLSNYGFGFGIGPLELHDGKTKVTTVGHSGGIHGFATLIVRVPESKEVVVLLDNTSRGGKLEEMVAGALSILRGIPPKQPKASIGEVVMAAVETSSVIDAVARYRTLKATQAAAYDFAEEELNTVGYQLLRTGRVADAIEIFKLNVEMFPQSANPYDSLGEAYAASGNKALAIANYRRVLELKPANPNAVEALKRLEQPAEATDRK